VSVPYQLVLAFWGVSALLVFTPGVDWAYAITSGLEHRSVAPAVAGMMLGYVGLTLLVAAGVAGLVASHPLVLDVLTLAGAVYLMVLGVSILSKPGSIESLPRRSADGAWPAHLIKGAGISGTNPKGLLLFLALLPQFTAPGTAWPLALQIGVLGLVHALSCGVVYSGVGLAARAALTTRPAVARWVTRLSGSAMVLIGLSLLGERVIGLLAHSAA
jgi:threonine/homoserine/homoserine lactone efflux protein